MGTFRRLCVITFICCANVFRIDFLIEPLCRFLLALTVNSYSVDLMEVQVRVDSDETCREAYSSYKKIVIDNRVLCVSSINAEEEPCKGLSGAPLMLPQGSAFYQIGFVSYGTIGGKKPSIPCVYTRVSPYMDFITSALK